MTLPPNLKITNSFTESQIAELINYTNNDSLIGKFTHDYERYKNREMYDEWAKEERSLYVLTNEVGSLLGMIKFELLSMPDKRYQPNFNPQDYPITFGIRLYGPARGQGFAKPFAQTVFKLFYESNLFKTAEAKGIWLGVDGRNEVAIKLYEYLGFKKVTVDDSWIMVLFSGYRKVKRFIPLSA